MMNEATDEIDRGVAESSPFYRKEPWKWILPGIAVIISTVLGYVGNEWVRSLSARPDTAEQRVTELRSDYQLTKQRSLRNEKSIEQNRKIIEEIRNQNSKWRRRVTDSLARIEARLGVPGEKNAQNH